MANIKNLSKNEDGLIVKLGPEIRRARTKVGVRVGNGLKSRRKVTRFCLATLLNATRYPVDGTLWGRSGIAGKQRRLTSLIRKALDSDLFTVVQAGTQTITPNPGQTRKGQ